MLPQMLVHREGCLSYVCRMPESARVRRAVPHVSVLTVARRCPHCEASCISRHSNAGRLQRVESRHTHRQSAVITDRGPHGFRPAAL